MSSSPTEGKFNFLIHLDTNFVQKCQICVVYENLDLCYCSLWMKNSNIQIYKDLINCYRFIAKKFMPVSISIMSENMFKLAAIYTLMYNEKKIDILLFSTETYCHVLLLLFLQAFQNFHDFFIFIKCLSFIPPFQRSTVSPLSSSTEYLRLNLNKHFMDQSKIKKYLDDR